MVRALRMARRSRAGIFRNILVCWLVHWLTTAPGDDDSSRRRGRHATWRQRGAHAFSLVRWCGCLITERRPVVLQCPDLLTFRLRLHISYHNVGNGFAMLRARKYLTVAVAYGTCTMPIWLTTTCPKTLIVTLWDVLGVRQCEKPRQSNSFRLR